MSERGLASFFLEPSALCLKLQTKVRDQTNQGGHSNSLLKAGDNARYHTAEFSLHLQLGDTSKNGEMLHHLK